MLTAVEPDLLTDLVDFGDLDDGPRRFATIAEATAAARAAEDRADRLQKVLDTAHDAYASLSLTGEILAWNKRARQLFGWSSNEVVGRSLGETILPPSAGEDGSHRVQELIQTQGAGKRIEIEATTRDGCRLPIEVSIAPMRHGNSFVLNAFMHDVTARRQLQAQLTHAQRLESVGQLSAGIAHEINTPTQYVGDNTRFLGESFRDLLAVLTAYGELAHVVRAGGDSAAALAQVEEAITSADLDYLTDEIGSAISQSLEGIHRVASIVRAMKEFSHPGSVEKKASDINKCLQNTVTVATNEWKYVAHVEFDLDEGLPLVPCLPGDLNQVFLNLIVNSAQAIGEKLGTSPAEKGEIRIATRQNSDGVEVCIGDNGAGIPDDVRQRIFDPFFTTKDVGIGSGQGLAIARAVVVEKHQGRISFETEAGVGTIFTIWLPVDQET